MSMVAGSESNHTEAVARVTFLPRQKSLLPVSYCAKADGKRSLHDWMIANSLAYTHWFGLLL
jgi:hypothetical protein